MKKDIESALRLIVGHALDAVEAKRLLEQIYAGTIDRRAADYELDSNLVMFGAMLMSKSDTNHKILIARKWLIAACVPEEQLDELIVIAKLSREA